MDIKEKCKDTDGPLRGEKHVLFLGNFFTENK